MPQASIISASGDQNLHDFWREMMRPEGQALREKFTVEHVPLVRKAAMRIRARLPAKVELDDLMQVGMIGLARALYAFNPRRGVKFTTFAAFYVRGAIFDHLRAADWAPRLVRQRTRSVEEAMLALQQKLGRKPSEEELADYLKLSVEEFIRLSHETRPVSQVSLTQTRFTDDSGRPVSHADLCADTRAPSPAREAERGNLKDLITRGLDPAERLVLILYYYEQMTMREIGLTLDLSESRVCQMHTSILERLKARLGEQEAEFESEET